MRQLAFASFIILAACSSSQGTDRADTTSSADTVQDDQSDTGCQVVLRDTGINFEGRLGPQTDCSSGTCWVIVTVTFDVAMSQSLNGAEAYVLYQGGASSSWVQSAQATPVFGAPVGFRRYQVALNNDTFPAGNGANSMQLIPFIATYAGARYFDHNRVAGPLGAYQLAPTNNWTISDAPSVCPGNSSTNTLALTFATGWSDSHTGTLAGGGKLDVNYDIFRMPQTLNCTTDGVQAYATESYVQFQPSGVTLQETINGPLDATYKPTSLPLEYDVPAGTTSASLWFHTSSDCGGDAWDSNFGQNYTYRTP